MLRQLRKSIINYLWEQHRNTTSQLKKIECCLSGSYTAPLPLDHFALIDLPGPHSGIPSLRDIFSLIGYQERGNGYLPDKQNDFLWMADIDSLSALAIDALPQAVVADFRLDQMPPEISRIIEKYANQSSPFPIANANKLIEQLHNNNNDAAATLFNLIVTYLRGRDWPLPTKAEFNLVKEFNELLSWVLVFGRKPNHFTLSVHLMETFKSLETFHSFIVNDVHLLLNQDGGIIKGGLKTGIAQGSTIGTPQTITLADGNVEMPTGFVEFVWRYPVQDCKTPLYWTDYFTGFVAQHANHVIQSLFLKPG